MLVVRELKKGFASPEGGAAVAVVEVGRLNWGGGAGGAGGGERVGEDDVAASIGGDIGGGFGGD